MEINLYYSEKEIKWNYNTENYIYEVDDIEFVTENCQYNLILEAIRNETLIAFDF